MTSSGWRGTRSSVAAGAGLNLIGTALLVPGLLAGGAPGGTRSTARLFAAYAGVSMVLVVLLGFGLTASYRSDAERRGLAEGLSQARLLASSAIEPLLDGRPLSAGLSTAESAGLQRLARRTEGARDVLRLRLRDTAGRVVFGADGSGTSAHVAESSGAVFEAAEAAEGEPVARITQVTSDSGDTSEPGEEAVEVFLPLRTDPSGPVVGVLELHLPYRPVAVGVSLGMSTIYRDLAIGLLALCVAVFLLSVSMSRGLRRQVRINQHLAEHDPLTELPNRAAFLSRVRRSLETADDDGVPIVVAIIDLDRFKEINDTLGHESGDDLLGEMAVRLRQHLRGQDAVARLGGDEFGLVLHGARDPEAALWRVRAVLEQETIVRGLALSVSSSIGYVLAPQDGEDAALLLQRADVALYIAKSGHGGVARYCSAHDHHDASRLALTTELRRALDDDELVLHYQPKLCLVDGRTESIEALVRWQHPVHGLLGPDRFVPLVEQTDLIDDLTRWVLDRALADLGTLDRAGNGFANDEATRLAVAVNVSARSVGRHELIAMVSGALARSGVDASRLTIEITETALLVDPVRAAEVLFEISDLGVSVSLDDFGVGQTSLSYLATLPIHEIKIDRSFVTALLDHPTHIAIARSITDLGRNLGVRVVAEGVETTAVADALRELRCELAQGWLYAHAMPIDELRTWLRATTDDASVVPVPEATHGRFRPRSFVARPVGA